MKTDDSHSDAHYTEDTLLGGRVIVRQPISGYRAALDPVLLAAAVSAKAGQNVLDAGCGTGAAMFCLAARVSGLQLTGLEVQSNLAAFARAGVALNKLEGSARILDGDIGRPPLALKNAFDIVLTNPPYVDAGSAPPNRSLATAHREDHVDLAAWIAGCLACLKQTGRFVMIHRADRLSDILTALHEKAGDIRIFPVLPKAGEAARRVIVDAGKDRRSPDTLFPCLVLHDEEGGYTAAVEGVLRDAKPLPI
jgi:tRNA1(Val) A37 N6-methylase TrmN6